VTSSDCGSRKDSHSHPFHIAFTTRASAQLPVMGFNTAPPFSRRGDPGSHKPRPYSAASASMMLNFSLCRLCQWLDLIIPPASGSRVLTNGWWASTPPLLRGPGRTPPGGPEHSPTVGGQVSTAQATALPLKGLTTLPVRATAVKLTPEDRAQSRRDQQHWQG
jgi:hypothetical protein